MDAQLRRCTNFFQSLSRFLPYRNVYKELFLGLCDTVVPSICVCVDVSELVFGLLPMTFG